MDLSPAEEADVRLFVREWRVIQAVFLAAIAITIEVIRA